MKKVVIYGLPRSGTNYLEYLVRNNITCIYDIGTGRECKYLRNPDPSGVTPHTIMPPKHCKPTKSDGDVFIFILKNRRNFIKSFNEYYPKHLEIQFVPNTNRMYDDAANDYIEFYRDNASVCAIVFWEDLYRNPEHIIRSIGRKFGIYVNPTFINTSKITYRDAGRSVSNIEFSPGDRFDFNWDFDKSHIVAELKKYAVR